MDKKFIPTIGLEIHAELKTNSKMFCSCKNDPEEKNPNVNICPVCLGHPGTLPVANIEAIKKTIKAGLALNCETRKESKFDRKNYFYPDLPKGYQISQYDAPFCENGYLEIKGRKIKIRRIHLEEDTGRLLHPEGVDHSLIDFNRSGVPLMELVTEPDISSGKEAKKFAEELQLILKYLNISDANMEKGQMRVEVNISLSDKKEFGTKVEIKNLNSIRIVGKSIDYEIKRQTELLNRGEKVVQETRGWHDKKEITFSQREKEEAHDYRYFPEPDIPPIYLKDDFINEVASKITELPASKRKRFKDEYGLSEKEVEIYISQKDLSEYFENVASELREWVGTEKGTVLKEEEFKKVIKILSNYLSSDLLGLIKGFNDQLKATPENFAEFIKMIYLGEISSKAAKAIFEEVIKTGKDPSHIVEEKGLSQISDDKYIEEAAEKIIKENPEPVKNYKKGKENALQFLVGKIMQETKGKANPNVVQEILRKKLKE